MNEWVGVAYIALQLLAIVGTILMIGEERKPTTNTWAAIYVMIAILLIWLTAFVGIGPLVP